MTLSFNIKIHCKCLICTVHSSADYLGLLCQKYLTIISKVFDILNSSIQQLMENRAAINDWFENIACCHFHLNDKCDENCTKSVHMLVIVHN